MNARNTIRIALVALLPAAAACASSQRSDGAAEGIPIRVLNNAIPPTSMTVYMVPQTGMRQMLGVVSSSDTTVLRFRQAPTAGTYRLVGETNGGAPIASREFTLVDPGIVEWTVYPNTVRVTTETP